MHGQRVSPRFIEPRSSTLKVDLGRKGTVPLFQQSRYSDAGIGRDALDGERRQILAVNAVVHRIHSSHSDRRLLFKVHEEALVLLSELADRELNASQRRSQPMPYQLVLSVLEGSQDTVWLNE